jgi:acyl-CoA synthetase (AMP-forming)/AMP-acid ligase II
VVGGRPSADVPDPLFDAQLAIRALSSLASTRLLGPVRPDRMVQMALAPLRVGLGLATIVALGAARHPDHPALIDERGTLTYGELDRRAAGVAAGLRRDFGVGPDRALAVMCRNHRGFLEGLLAGSRCGADLLLLNTDFSGPQLAEVVEREGASVVVHDAEFTDAIERAGFGDRRIVAWHERDLNAPTLDALIERGGRSPRNHHAARFVLLTSGTTGAPKGAPRAPSPSSLLGPWTALAGRVPLRAREPMLIAPPLFHGFGFSYLALGLALGATIVIRRRFDPVAVLDDLERHRIRTLVAVPVMHQRILWALRSSARRRETSSLRVLISAAAPLTPALAESLMDAFGDVLYDIYGTTETGFGAIAGPEDLRAAPGTVGRPPFGTELRILDETGHELSPGVTGHVFIGGPLVFEGYSGGGSKETSEGLMNTGDVGHLDENGRLFIDGREDDMIVSGGENVFPGEVEDLLRRHAGVEDAAVIGVDDEEFGQRLSAFVVATEGVDLSEDELKGYVRDNLARFKIPRDVVFLDEVPRNPTGKVVKAKLPTRA